MAAIGPGSLRNTLRLARIAQIVTVAWMLIEGGVAVAAGLVAHSVALTAFGFDSFIELGSAAVVLGRLLGRTVDEERGALTGAERRASRIVGLALYVLIAYIVLAAIVAVAMGIRAEASPVGIALSVTSLLVMAGLWRWRLNLADRLGSPALRGDAACSAVCLYLAGATLVGLGLNAVFGLWWADALAGLTLIWWIRGEAREAFEVGVGDGPAIS